MTKTGKKYNKKVTIIKKLNDKTGKKIQLTKKTFK